MTLKTAVIATITASALALGACASTSVPQGTAAYAKPEYTLDAGDKLRIIVFGEDDIGQDYVVSSAGDVDFPFIGNVPVTGKTVDGLRNDLQTRLGSGFLKHPRVTVEVLNYRPFYILGEVNNAGRFPVDDQLTVVQAIALAGGYSYRADERVIYITRANSGQEEEYSLRDGRPIYVGPGDTLRVGERYF